MVFHATDTFQLVTEIHLVSVCSGSEGNPEGFPVTIRHRWPYTIAVVADNIECIMVAI